MTLLVAFVLGFFPTPVAHGESVTCPMGAGRTELTIQRVMMNFGKYTSKAEALIAPTMPPSSVTDADVAKALSDLQIVVACADAVVKSTSEAMLPTKAFNLKGTDRDQFVA